MHLDQVALSISGSNSMQANRSLFSHPVVEHLGWNNACWCHRPVLYSDNVDENKLCRHKAVLLTMRCVLVQSQSMLSCCLQAEGFCQSKVSEDSCEVLGQECSRLPQRQLLGGTSMRQSVLLSPEWSVRQHSRGEKVSLLKVAHCPCPYVDLGYPYFSPRSSSL